MESYRKVNNIVGWSMFVIASTVFILTSESTASFWDCGEYIATAYKLQVGHPPGAPLFQMLGRFFSLFAFGHTALVARMVNTMSALSSGLTIMFLFWTITLLAKKIVIAGGEMTKVKMVAIMGSGIIGALAYSFTDSFWFSAVEGEVYGMSSCYTAIVFWAILKWEETADEKRSLRWIVLIAYLIGLSIGVHMLNLLAIPSITFVYYFKKHPSPSFRGIVGVFLLSLLLLAFVMYIIIPWTVKLAGAFELFFVNTLGLPFNTGTVIYFVLLTGGILWAWRFTRRRHKVVWNTIIVCVTFILIGYSSFLMLVIRSNADTPINEDKPKDAIGLLAYLNREQYGNWPLLYGPYYNAPIIGQKDGKPVYAKDEARGKYVIIDARKDALPVYDPRFMTVFPRMWCNTEPYYADGYKQWGRIKGIPVSVTDQNGKSRIIMKPTFGENLRFFIAYQVNYMYWRYFMWNFAGRQDDNQGYGDDLNGNWISGITFLDEMRLGPQTNLPEDFRNKARNKFYMLPLLLGLIGLIYHWQKNKKDTSVVALLFIMTGLAIVVYLNQYAPQPRERDYAYAGSFYAFAIWIGLGVLGLIEWLRLNKERLLPVILVILACLVLVPANMAREDWNDHDRSGRYIARSTAINYLNSCAPGAILFTNADNDTFPLWYAQEVENIRTDVRVVNLSLLNTDWYIDEMKRKAYDSDPVPFSLTNKVYHQGSFDIVYLIEHEQIKDYVNLHTLMDLLEKDTKEFEFMSDVGRIDYLPAKKFMVPVDSATVVGNGTVPRALSGRIAPLKWKVDNTAIYKNDLMILDLLGSNDWKRPVYFVSTAGDDAYLGLQDYFQMEGLAYRVIPVKMDEQGGLTGHVDTKIMYDHVMNQFDFTNLNNPRIYLDETARRMTYGFRNIFSRLAYALLMEGKRDSAVAVCDRCVEAIPDSCVPYNPLILPIAETYFAAGQSAKGAAIFSRLLDYYEQELAYYFSFSEERIPYLNDNIRQALALVQHIYSSAGDYGQTALSQRADTIMKVFTQNYIEVFSKDTLR